MLQSKIDKLTKPLLNKLNMRKRVRVIEWQWRRKELTIRLPIREIMNICEKHFELRTTFRSQPCVHLNSHSIHHLPQPLNRTLTPFLNLPQHSHHSLPLPPALHSPSNHHRRHRARHRRQTHRYSHHHSPHSPWSNQTKLHPTKRRRFLTHVVHLSST